MQKRRRERERWDHHERWKETKLVIMGDSTLSIYKHGGEGGIQYLDVSRYKFDANGTDVWAWEDW
jgi:hypothetical protein